MEASEVVQVGQVIDVLIAGFGKKGDGVARYGPTKLAIIITGTVSEGSRYEVLITHIGEKAAFAKVLQELR